MKLHSNILLPLFPLLLSMQCLSAVTIAHSRRAFEKKRSLQPRAVRGFQLTSNSRIVLKVRVLDTYSKKENFTCFLLPAPNPDEPKAPLLLTPDMEIPGDCLNIKETLAPISIYPGNKILLLEHLRLAVHVPTAINPIYRGPDLNEKLGALRSFALALDGDILLEGQKGDIAVLKPRTVSDRTVYSARFIARRKKRLNKNTLRVPNFLDLSVKKIVYIEIESSSTEKKVLVAIVPRKAPQHAPRINIKPYVDTSRLWKGWSWAVATAPAALVDGTVVMVWSGLGVMVCLFEGLARAVGGFGGSTGLCKSGPSPCAGWFKAIPATRTAIIKSMGPTRPKDPGAKPPPSKDKAADPRKTPRREPDKAP